jgi:MinD-like ATPase involved in chromosome partitioning or flagellar assembly
VLLVDGKSDAADGGSAVCSEVLRISAGRDAEPVTVDKYAGCSRICAEAKAAYAAVHGSGGFSRGTAACASLHLISFVGVDGGAGTSSLALGLAAELSAYRGKNVLYLSFETVESSLLGTDGRAATRGDMSGFLFELLRGGQTQAASATAPYLSRDDYGVMRFRPSSGLNRLRELDAAELGRFMAVVADESDPDIVVADWGGGFCDAAAEYIAGSSFVVFVAKHSDGKTPAAGGASLLSLADELGVDRSRAVAVFGRVPAVDEAYENGILEERRRVECVEICEDPYAFDRDAGRVSLSLATSFGTGVKRLANIVLGVEDEAAPAPDDVLRDVFTDAA